MAGGGLGGGTNGLGAAGGGGGSTLFGIAAANVGGETNVIPSGGTGGNDWRHGSGVNGIGVSVGLGSGGIGENTCAIDLLLDVGCRNWAGGTWGHFPKTSNNVLSDLMAADYDGCERLRKRTWGSPSVSEGAA